MHEHCAAGAARTAKLARRAKGRMPAVKIKSYPLLRRRSGSSGSKNRTSKIKMDDQLRC